MSKVVAVKRDSKGRNILFRTDDGNIYDVQGCAEAINKGEIEGLMAVLGKPDDSGDQPLVIRGYADGDPSNNLDNLPTF